MSSAAMGMLCDFLEYDSLHVSSVIYADLDQRPLAQYLAELDVLTPSDRISEMVTCDSCGDSEVHHILPHEAQYRGYCAECGWVELSLEKAKDSVVRVEKVVHWLMAELDLYELRWQQAQEIVPQQCWQLGQLTIKRKRYTLFFGRNIGSVAGLSQKLDEVSVPSRRILITSTPLNELSQIQDTLCIPFNAIARFKKSGVTIDNIEAYLEGQEKDIGINETSLRLLDRKFVIVDGEEIKISPQVKAILSYLLMSQRPKTRQDIMNAIDSESKNFKVQKAFKRCPSVYEIFIEHIKEDHLYQIKQQYRNS